MGKHLKEANIVTVHIRNTDLLEGSLTELENIIRLAVQVMEEERKVKDEFNQRVADTRALLRMQRQRRMIIETPLPNEERLKVARATLFQVRKQLVDFHPTWIRRLLDAVADRSLEMNGLLCRELLQAVVESAKSGKLLIAVSEEILKSDASPALRCYASTMLMFWFNLNQHFTSQLLRGCTPASPLGRHIQIMLYFWLYQGNTFSVVPSECKPFSEFIAERDSGKRYHYFFFSPHQAVRDIMSGLSEAAHAVWLPQQEAISRTRELIPDWSIVDALWQCIATEARCGLHLEGEKVTIRIPDLQAVRLDEFVLTPQLGSWPCAMVKLHSTTCGFDDSATFMLRNGRLEGAEELFLDYFNWLLTVTVLAAYWKIVSRFHIEEERPEKCAKGAKGNGQPRTRKLPCPHFMRLCGERRASADAIARATQYMGRPPSDHYTFWAPRDESITHTQVFARVRLTMRPDDLASILSATTTPA